MIFTTKLNIGDAAYGIRRESLKRAHACMTCETSGRVTIAGESFPCPKCGGNGKTHEGVWAWLAQYIGTIGSVHACTEDRYGSESDDGDDDAPKPTQFIEYMATMTGVGSGQVWHERDVWATKDDAQAECDRRNGKLEIRRCRA